MSCVHDCSKGGVAVAISEMAILGGVGFNIFIDKIPNSCYSIDKLAFLGISLPICNRDTGAEDGRKNIISVSMV